MTVVIGTAGHIDHGKTTLLRALTGIDADRLPEERRRGMTIDVGYAHLTLDDGRVIDFVDVPGHDKLVGNMLIGAGEIDAAMLVVAADDGPRAQTLEHLALLDALGIAHGIAIITKADAVPPERTAQVVADVRGMLASTSLRDATVLVASGTTGQGIDDVQAALGALSGQMPVHDRPPSLAIDRVFSVKGRGVVVTGTLRGGPLTVGDRLRIVPAGPGSDDVRVREIQVHGTAVDRVSDGGRTALNLGSVGIGDVHRGTVLTSDRDVLATDRFLAAFTRDVADRTRGRIHIGTAAADVSVGRSGRDALTLPDGRPAGIVRTAAPVAMRPGDRFLIRRGPGIDPIGGVILDPVPPRGISRRRQTPERVAALTIAPASARLDLHGATVVATRVELAPDVASAAAQTALAVVAAATAAGARDVAITDVRLGAVASLRRRVSITRDAAALAATTVVERLVVDGQLVQDGDRIGMPGAMFRVAPEPELVAAMDRLESALAVPAPPSLAEAARTAGCGPGGVRALEDAGRIVVVAPDMAFAAATHRDLVELAMTMAADAPLTPAAFRDATGTSRKYVMAILEDLDRRRILRRTPAGHVPGPRAAVATSAVGTHDR